jgi:hypothetical protein
MGTMVLMRSALAGFVFLLAIPAAYAQKPPSHCKDTCKSSYTLCMKRSNTKSSRKACKAQKKTCRKGCKG